MTCLIITVSPVITYIPQKWTHIRGICLDWHLPKIYQVTNESIAFSIIKHKDLKQLIR